MIVNNCETATNIETQYSLATYSAEKCETVTDEITSSIDFRSKLLTQDANEDHYDKNDERTVPYFTNRLKTFLMP